MGSQELGTKMSTSQAVTDEEFRELIRMAEEWECIVKGAKLPDARAALARRWKVAAGSLSNIRRGRFKELRTSIRQSIGAGLYADLGAELIRINHVQERLRQCGFGPCSSEMREVENVLAKVRDAYRAMARCR